MSRKSFRLESKDHQKISYKRFYEALVLISQTYNNRITFHLDSDIKNVYKACFAYNDICFIHFNQYHLSITSTIEHGNTFTEIIVLHLSRELDLDAYYAKPVGFFNRVIARLTALHDFLVRKPNSLKNTIKTFINKFNLWFKIQRSRRRAQLRQTTTQIRHQHRQFRVNLIRALLGFNNQTTLENPTNITFNSISTKTLRQTFISSIIPNNVAR